MKKIILLNLCVLVFSMMGGGAYAAPETSYIVAGEAAVDDRTVRDLVDLANKYDATGKLPRPVVVEGKPCPKADAATCLLTIIEKVLDKNKKEGKDAVAAEDLDKISALHEALKDELEKHEGYLTLRESINSILAKPEEPPFLFKAGAKGLLRGEGVGNQRLTDFSYNPGHSEGRFLYRVLPYAYWHPTDFLDIHLEGQGYGYSGGSQYLGQVSLYQGYVEGKIPDKEWLALKVGRQDFAYGSSFILGANTFFQGLAFDAARLRVKPFDALIVDLLGGWYATPWSAGVKGNLVGGYASYAVKEGTVIEAYGFNDIGSDEHHGGEYRNIWGLRGTAKIGPVSIEFEPVYESGRTLNSESDLNDRINAWGGHADLTVETNLFNRKNTFVTGYAYGSGGKDAANGLSIRGEFRNPNNDTSLTGDMSVVTDLSGVNAGGHHASGLQLFNLGWGVELTNELNFTAYGRYFYANAVPDGFSRNIGLETDFTLTYAVNENLSVIAGYDHFITGGFFRDATGSTKDIDYGYLMLQFDFSKSKPRLKPVKG
jgi:hypothetical protein